ncbi:MAG: AsmA-like C-terminal region-containing protein [Flavobacteriales bacterium]
MNRTLRIIKISLISLASLLVVLVVATFIVLKYYEDDVVNYALDEARSKLKTKSSFGPADLAFWETFPNASIRFTDVYIEETFDTKDTLIFAKEVFVEFNLFDLFRGKYDLEALDIRDAQSSLKVNAKGQDNWHFWISDTTDTSDFNIAMEKINLTNVGVSYDDRSSDFIVQLAQINSEMEGSFSGKKMALVTELKCIASNLKSKDESYALNQEIAIKAGIEADTEKNEYKISEGNLSWGEMPFSLAGILNFSEKSFVDISVSGNSIDLEGLQSALPASFRGVMDDYNPEGKMDLVLKMKGNTCGKEVPEIDAHFKIEDGEIEEKTENVSIDHVVCEMHYVRNTKTDQLTIRSMSAKLNDGSISLSGNIKNLDVPILSIQAQLSGEMSDLRDFFRWDTLEVCEGHLNATCEIKGKLTYDKETSKLNWDKIQSSGEAELTNGLLRLKNSNREFRELAVKVQFKDMNAHVQNLSGVVNGSDFKIDGSIQNLIPFLANDEARLTMNANLRSSTIDFTNLIETSSSTSSNEEYQFVLPHRIDFRMNCEVGKFVFRKFEATSVEGVAELKNKRFVVDPVAFNTADGSFNAQLAFEQTTDQMYRMNCLANLKDINIQKLFTEFENFDQDFIQDRHLSGIANATVQFRTSLTTSLDIVQDKIESLVDLTIDNGQLNDLESLQGIAAYIRDNKWAAPFVDEDRFAEKMKNIRFSKLENVIEIKDRTIVIPQMDIKSTAMDLSAKGIHGFDNKIEYTIGFSLREILVRKQTEWEEQDDGLGKRLFVTMTGTTDVPVFKIDKDAAKENRQEELAVEKQNVKALLKEEFGMFKKDNGVGTYKEKTTPVQSSTSIQWDGFDAAEEPERPVKEEKRAPAETTPPPPKDGKKVPKWLKEKK